MKKTRGSQTLLTGILLTLIGGFFDAYTYYSRGGVFANAQTGNIIKMAICIGEGKSFIRFLIPICVFILGTFLSLIIHTYCHKHKIRMIRRIIIAIEMCLSIIVAFIPDSLNILATSIVSLICALQMHAFKEFDGVTMLTTVATGNLRKMVESFYHFFVHGNKDKLRQACIYLLVLFCFMSGVIIGVILTSKFHQYSSLFLVIPFIIIIIKITLHNKYVDPEFSAFS